MQKGDTVPNVSLNLRISALAYYLYRSDFSIPILLNRCVNEVPNTPKAYTVLRDRLIDEAPLKYLGGQVIFPPGKPF